MSVYKKVEAVASEREKAFEKRFELIESHFVDATVTSGLDISTPAAVIVASDAIEVSLEFMVFEDREFLANLETKPNWKQKFEAFTGLTVYKNKLMTVTRCEAQKAKKDKP